ncbi:DUF7109 family protein [Halovivax cerinus]|uniref:Uncharacterized protein n=1 Tax=Halovivax cerinus TaxID=1487865 RepID=A0ABD5NK45_9EURY|nr:hypothetical protein [Halovivax cerinus]
MEPTVDELAGIVDLFGALTRSELERALTELAARTGRSEPAAADAIDAALESFALLACDVDGSDGFVAGPAAFPTLPPHAEDLPHILEVPPRSPSADELARLAGERFAAEVDQAVDANDEAHARDLLDLSYEVEAWAPVDLDDERDRLDALCD